MWAHVCMCVCMHSVRACMYVSKRKRERERERESVCVCVCAHAHTHVCMCVRMCAPAHPPAHYTVEIPCQGERGTVQQILGQGRRYNVLQTLVWDERYKEQQRYKGRMRDALFNRDATPG